MEITIDTSRLTGLSPYIFGHNLEHTRSAVGGGLSAQMLRNRKFAGKPQKNLGLAAEWEPVGGECAFFQLGARPAYTRHIGCEKMPRNNEINSMSITNLKGNTECGMAQKGLSVIGGAVYEIRVTACCRYPAALRAALTDSDGKKAYCETEISIAAGEWQTAEFKLTPSENDAAAALRLTFREKGELVFGAVSMMKEGHFHGMRADVVELLKMIGPSVIRWPGGNFAGEYRWKDGLLPSDMRGPLQSFHEIETQPHSGGYDFHEISTDDFVALCREVGAEPFLTINLSWNSVGDSADWVEYCNGSADTEYGRRRAENGHPEPYNVKFWSLGNEMGYGHMEGPSTASGYAEIASRHAKAMKEKSPDIELFSSGPYPNDVWAKDSAAALYPGVGYVSLHHYAGSVLDYTSPEKTEETYNNIVSAVSGAKDLLYAMRGSLNKYCADLKISFDEWNYWYAWYRPSCVGEGIFTARMLHMLISESAAQNSPFCCYFQPIGEGAVIVEPTSAKLTANGRMFSVMKEHKGGELCSVGGADDYSAVATVKEGVMTVTLINQDYSLDREFSFSVKGEVIRSLLYASDSVEPYTYFDESEFTPVRNGDEIMVTLPPHSVALISVRIA